MNYEVIASRYKPTKIKTLLIGEAPPPSRKKYFYKVPSNYSFSNTIENDSSLPATIFNHYFGQRPKNSEDYEKYLICLKENGIFLIDMFKKPEKFRGDKDNQKKLFTDESIKLLEDEIFSIRPDKIIFLLARGYLKSQLDILKFKFQHADLIRWKDFRMTSNKILECKLTTVKGQTESNRV